MTNRREERSREEREKRWMGGKPGGSHWFCTSGKAFGPMASNAGVRAHEGKREVVGELVHPVFPVGNPAFYRFLIFPFSSGLKSRICGHELCPVSAVSVPCWIYITI